MIKKNEIYKYIFIDLETARIKNNYHELDEHYKSILDKKAAQLGYSSGENLFLDKATLYPEYSKICCISLGVVDENDNLIKVVALVGNDEFSILTRFLNILNKKSYPTLCGHNIKKFDLPFIIKRCVYTGILLPNYFHFWDKKPWELNIVDTCELLKINNSDTASLDLLCAVFNLPSPKKSIDGLKVNEKFYLCEYDIIGEYCNLDVVSTIKVAAKMAYMYEVCDFKINYSIEKYLI